MLKFVEICRKTLRIVEKVENYQKMSNNVQVWFFFFGGGDVGCWWHRIKDTVNIQNVVPNTLAPVETVVLIVHLMFYFSAQLLVVTVHCISISALMFI